MLAQVVLVLALLLILVGMIMVLLDAFNESLLWGLLVLLMPPIFIPIYSFVKWRKSQARNGFSMTLVGLVMLVVSAYGGALQSIPFLNDYEAVSNLPTAGPKNEPLSNEQEAANVELEDEESYDPMLSTDKDRFSASEIEPLAPEQDKTVKNVGKSKARAVNIPVENISSSMGADIEITFNDGVKLVGTLVKTTEDSISIEQQTGGGTVSYEYTLDKIKSILQLTRPNPTTSNITAPPATPSVVEQSPE